MLEFHNVRVLNFNSPTGRCYTYSETKVPTQALVYSSQKSPDSVADAIGIAELIVTKEGITANLILTSTGIQHVLKTGLSLYPCVATLGSAEVIEEKEHVKDAEVKYLMLLKTPNTDPTIPPINIKDAIE